MRAVASNGELGDAMVAVPKDCTNVVFDIGAIPKSDCERAFAGEADVPLSTTIEDEDIPAMLETMFGNAAKEVNERMRNPRTLSEMRE
jgi:hypothetical protein